MVGRYAFFPFFDLPGISASPEVRKHIGYWKEIAPTWIETHSPNSMLFKCFN